MVGPNIRLTLAPAPGLRASLNVIRVANNSVVGWIRVRDAVAALESIGAVVRLPEGQK